MDKKVLERLEEKTRLAVEALTSLRAENAQLNQALEKARTGGDGNRDQLDDEIRLLHDERSAIRKRVESLIDLIEGAL